MRSRVASTSRLGHVAWVVCAVGCGTATPSEPSQSQSLTLHASHKHDDAGGSSPTQADAGEPTGATGASVACFTEGDPTASCAQPEHCCFTNYSAAHDGYCSSDPCAYGTLDCDGAEDCASGSVCCAQAIVDPVDGTVGYVAACTAGPCVTTPLVHELCHAGAAGGCSAPNATCASAADADYDLPRVLGVCP